MAESTGVVRSEDEDGERCYGRNSDVRYMSFSVFQLYTQYKYMEERETLMPIDQIK